MRKVFTLDCKDDLQDTLVDILREKGIIKEGYTVEPSYRAVEKSGSFTRTFWTITDKDGTVIKEFYLDDWVEGTPIFKYEVNL